MKDSEKKIQNRLTGAGIGALALAPLTGPFAPLYLGIAGAIFFGKAIRGIKNRDYEDKPQNNYREGSNQGSLIPESPETAVARNNPDEASKLLRKLYSEKTQQVALASANKLCETYLTHLSEEKLEKSKGVSVSFRRTFGDLVGLVTNEKKGFNLDIDLKE